MAEAVDLQIGDLSTAKVARASWDANGAIIVTADLVEAMPLVNRLAPEHLELACDEADALFDMVKHAGSVFIGRYTPEAVGDYVAGPNHVLPTGRRARFSSGLSVLVPETHSFLSLPPPRSRRSDRRPSPWPRPRGRPRMPARSHSARLSLPFDRTGRPV